MSDSDFTTNLPNIATSKIGLGSNPSPNVTNIDPGLPGQVLTSGGEGGEDSWADTVAPSASSTVFHSLARWANTSGTSLTDSNILLDDFDNLSGINDLAAENLEVNSNINTDSIFANSGLITDLQASSVTATIVTSESGAFTSSVTASSVSAVTGSFVSSVSTNLVSAVSGAFTSSVTANALSAVSGAFTSSVNANTISAVNGAFTSAVTASSVSAVSGFFTSSVSASTLSAVSASLTSSVSTVLLTTTGLASLNTLSVASASTLTGIVTAKDALRLTDDAGTNFVGIQAATAVASSYTVTLPDAAPTVGQSLRATTSTATTLAWSVNGYAATPTDTTGLTDDTVTDVTNGSIVLAAGTYIISFGGEAAITNSVPPTSATAYFLCTNSANSILYGNANKIGLAQGVTTGSNRNRLAYSFLYQSAGETIKLRALVDATAGTITSRDVLNCFLTAVRI